MASWGQGGPEAGPCTHEGTKPSPGLSREDLRLWRKEVTPGCAECCGGCRLNPGGAQGARAAKAGPQSGGSPLSPSPLPFISHSGWLPSLQATSGGWGRAQAGLTAALADRPQTWGTRPTGNFSPSLLCSFAVSIFTSWNAL